MIRKLLRREVRREIRSAGYSHLITLGLEATAAADNHDVLATGVVEAAAGVWGRTLSAARVEGTDVLTPRVLSRIGRDLIRCGESVHLIETRPTLHLIPVTSFDVRSGYRYDVELTEPPGKTVARNVAREAVMHAMWAADDGEPWRGIGPLQSASLLAKLAVQTESKLSEDLNTPTAALVPVPEDGGGDGLAGIKNDIRNAKGTAVLAEGTSTGWDDTRQAAGTRNDWRAERLGPMIPAELRGLYRDVALAVFGACGIPASLAAPADADGTQLREDYRRFVMTAVQPVAAEIAASASEALDVAVSFDFSRIWAHDLAGRASALAKLTTAGVPLDEARRLAGLA